MKSSRERTEAAEPANSATIKRFESQALSFSGSSSSLHIWLHPQAPSKCSGGIEDKEYTFPFFNWRSKVGRRSFSCGVGGRASAEIGWGEKAGQDKL